MRLLNITIQGFRAFNLKQTINLDNDVVLFFGTNGSGKSSICEAIEWLLYGEISRKQLANAKGEYTGNHIKNVHFEMTSEEEPFVELNCVVNGSKRRLKRVFKNSRSTECYLDETFVDNFEKLEINLDDEFKPILSQIGMRALVDCTKEERWNVFSSMLGLDELTALGKVIQQAIKDLDRNGDYNLKKNYVEKFINQLEAKGTYSELIQILKKNNSPLTLIIDDFKFDNINEEQCIEKLKNISNEVSKKQQTPEFVELIRPIAEPGSLSIKLNDLFSQLKKNISNLKSAPYDSQIIAIKKQGCQLINSKVLDECPVCDKPITQREKSKIEEIISENEETIEKIKNFKNQLDSINRQLKELKSGIASAIDLTNYESFLIDLSQLDEIKEETQSLKMLLDAMNQRNKHILEKNDAFILSIQKFLCDDIENSYEKNESTINTISNEILKNVENIKININSFNSSLIEILKKVKEKLQNQLDEREKAIIEKSGFYIDALNIFKYVKYVQIFDKKLEDLKDLKDSVVVFEESKAKDLILTFSSSIKEFYEKLNPGEEIIFEELRQVTGAKNSVEFVASFEGKEINPITHFSEAHCNSLALAVFFTQKVMRNNNFEFFVLDDPVQSLDDSHANTLVDLLKELYGQKQLIIFTHSNKFENSFLLEFYNSDIFHYKFDFYSQSGPVYDLENTNVEKSIAICKNAIIIASNSFTLKSAGNSLRITLESALKRILMNKNNKPLSDYSHMNLDKLINKYNSAFPNNSWSGSIERWKKTLNEDSHDNNMPEYKNTLIAYSDKILKFYQELMRAHV